MSPLKSEKIPAEGVCQKDKQKVLFLLSRCLNFCETQTCGNCRLSESACYLESGHFPSRVTGGGCGVCLGVWGVVGPALMEEIACAPGSSIAPAGRWALTVI